MTDKRERGARPPVAGGRNVIISLTLEEAERLDALAAEHLRLPSMQAAYELKRILAERVPA